MYHVKEAHNIFVTGVEFMPNSLTTRAIANDSEFTLVSISADNQIIMHQEMPPGTYTFLVHAPSLSQDFKNACLKQ